MVRDKAIEFLKNVCQHDGNACVNYRVYEYGSLIECLPFEKAVEKFLQDYEEMKEISEDKAFQMTCIIWKKHIVIFK